MKTKLLALLTCVGLTANAAEQEFSKGVDFTGLTGFTPATLNQLVDNATPAANRGLVYVGTTAPNTTTYPRFTNYLWLDVSTLPVVVKSYSTGSWASASIGAGTVTSNMLAANSVISDKIAANAIWTTNLNDNVVTSAKILTGAITDSKYAAGSITTGAISNNTITTSLILNSAVTSDKIATSAVTGDKIASGSISNSHLATSFAVYQTNIAVNAVANTNIQTGAIQATNITDGVISRAKLSFSLYTNTSPSAVAIPAAGATATIAHGLAGRPQIYNVVLVNTSTDLGWDVGDEVAIYGFSDASDQDQAFAVYADATNVLIVRADSASDGIDVRNKDTGVVGSIDTSKWTIKAYCVYYP